MLLQYFDAVGWVFWPVKPTTESENRLQLGSLSTSVNIDRLTMVDSTSAVGNDSRPWVVPQSIKWLSTIIGRDGSLRIQSGGFPHLFGTSLFPDIGSAWRARHDNNNNNNKQTASEQWIQKQLSQLTVPLTVLSGTRLVTAKLSTNNS